MQNADLISTKIVSKKQILQNVVDWRAAGKSIAFTNGVFDILHHGHIVSLIAAAREADILIVGLNADVSVKRLKGETRPINNNEARSIVLAALQMVDAIVLFEEDTPLELIKSIMPDVIIKGGDYTVDQIAGAKEVIANGGRVVINPILNGFSTTSIIEAAKKK
ncbi:MAG: D-glycero-beta-D-manno-heptose 1-phosphate adenylyltransferase [Chitinophagaceae bacterium]|nr:D-glycero-beta-D-manno-heptose 1-phosphate adenylyltransferase [Chitinophagaceae bacterium]